MQFYVTDAKRGRMEESKKGHFTKIIYKFEGDWAKRPATVQIVENYANAIQKAGGKVLYKSDSYVSGTLKKSGNTYYVMVNSDGSGDYTFTTVQEESMQQEVALNPAAIQKNIREDGKILIYGIYFDTNKAEVLPNSNATLQVIADYLKANPNQPVFIVGHTDNTGDYNQNIQLSKNRAMAVVNALVNDYKVPKQQVTPDGVGPLAPVASNDTQEGKAKNRRVELVKK